MDDGPTRSTPRPTFGSSFVRNFGFFFPNSRDTRLNWETATAAHLAAATRNTGEILAPDIGKMLQVACSWLDSTRRLIQSSVDHISNEFSWIFFFIENRTLSFLRPTCKTRPHFRTRLLKYIPKGTNYLYFLLPIEKGIDLLDIDSIWPCLSILSATFLFLFSFFLTSASSL